MTGDVSNDGSRIAIMKAMDEMGLPSFYRESGFQRIQWAKIPDSEVLSPEEVDAMPPYIRGFKCGNQFENGAPCGSMKFTNTGDVDCEKRKFRVSWHPGWYVPFARIDYCLLN